MKPNSWTYQLINQQIWVALVATSLVLFFLLPLQINLWVPALVSFLSFFCGYRYTKFQGTAYGNKLLTQHLVCGVLISALLVYFFGWYTWGKWLLIVALGLLYNSQFLPTSMRTIPLVKAFVVGVIWALMCSWLFLPQWNSAYFTGVFLLVSAQVIPFDIRDYAMDTVATLPNTLGINRAKIIGYFLLLASGYSIHLALLPAQQFAWWSCILVSLLGLWAATPRRSPLYFSLFIESVLTLPIVVQLLLKAYANY